MPNWVTNKLTINGSQQQIDAVKEFVKGDNNQTLDFNKIIPMPDKIYNTQSGKTTDKQKAYNLEKYGYKDWYEFCTNQWGTKWNADTIKENEDGFTFNTAWSPPTLVIDELSKKFPDSTFELSYVDEGGEFVETDTYENGHASTYHYEFDDENGQRLQIELWGEIRYPATDESDASEESSSSTSSEDTKECKPKAINKKKANKRPMIQKQKTAQEIRQSINESITTHDIYDLLKTEE